MSICADKVQEKNILLYNGITQHGNDKTSIEFTENVPPMLFKKNEYDALSEIL
jgi:hypothetical protein